MNVGALVAAVVAWAAAAAPSATVFYGEPNGPRPPAPSVRLKFIGGPDMIGLDEMVSVHGNANDFTLQGPRELTLSVTAAGDAAMQLASDLQTSLSRPDVQDTLSAAGLTSLSTSTLRDVSELLETKWEQRRQFDVEMMTTEAVTIQPGTVTSVAGSGTVTRPDGSMPKTATFKAPP